MAKTKMTKTNTNNQHRVPLYRRVWFIALVVLVAIAAIVCLIVIAAKPNSQPTPDDTNVTHFTPDKSDQKTTPNNTETQAAKPDESNSDPDQITVQYEGENPNRANELSGDITYTEYENGVLSIGTMINQYLRTGTCELKLTGTNGNTYTATSSIFAAASTSACSDFNVNVEPDSYQIEILLTSDEKQGIITGESN